MFNDYFYLILKYTNLSVCKALRRGLVTRFSQNGNSTTRTPLSNITNIVENETISRTRSKSRMSRIKFGGTTRGLFHRYVISKSSKKQISGRR